MPKRPHPADIVGALYDAENVALFYNHEAEKRDDAHGAALYLELAQSINKVVRQANDARSGQNWARTGESIRSRILSSVDQ